jgi:phage baseplate assembly protein W
MNMTFDLEYNSGRTKLIIPEYGRHIQKLVDHCVNLPSKEERNTMAKAIIDVMGNLQPHLRDVPDFKHKLWDQLHIMSDFKLDVDSPYEQPSQEELREKPESLPYPKSASKYRFYGTNIQTMIDVALTWEEGDMKEALAFAIANHMKKCYLNWNKDNVDDEVIFDHLFELTNGEINFKGREEELVDARSIQRTRSSQGKKKTHNKNSKNRKK